MFLLLDFGVSVMGWLLNQFCACNPVDVLLVFLLIVMMIQPQCPIDILLSSIRS